MTDAEMKLGAVLNFLQNEATSDHLNAVIVAIKHRREKLVRMNARALDIGDQVKFKSRDVEYRGKILSKQRKKALVACTFPIVNTYTVPLSMLEAA